MTSRFLRQRSRAGRNDAWSSLTDDFAMKRA
jgi:hypothetical protein